MSSASKDNGTRNGSHECNRSDQIYRPGKQDGETLLYCGNVPSNCTPKLGIFLKFGLPVSVWAYKYTVHGAQVSVCMDACME